MRKGTMICASALISKDTPRAFHCIQKLVRWKEYPIGVKQIFLRTYATASVQRYKIILACYRTCRNVSEFFHRWNTLSYCRLGVRKEDVFSCTPGLRPDDIMRRLTFRSNADFSVPSRKNAAVFGGAEWEPMVCFAAPMRTISRKPQPRSQTYQ